MHLTSPSSPRPQRVRLPRYAAIAGGAALLFGLLLTLVDHHWGPLARLDQGWTGGLHDVARGHAAWTASLLTMTALGGPTAMRILLALAAAWLWAIGARTLAGWTAAQAVVGWAAHRAAAALIARPRPSFADPVAHAAGPAFPSGHATASAITTAALVALVWPRAPRSGRIAACALAAGATVLIGFTRVALGVHWPSDILGGWFLAVAVLGSTTVVVELLRPGALSRDVRRVDWRTRPRVQSVLASTVPFPELPPPGKLHGEFEASDSDPR
ncbi:phosphatase PAP2 family protein [Kitasatospora sp. NPDC052896]|uniref:phosphatase PAP2 family protein n=1 Tax=Kitasatospora sp. NPDC052896 TaxID=3364061 RepID=UPI0037C4FE78